MTNADCYREWMTARAVRGVLSPDMRGLFWLGRSPRVLPWIHAWTPASRKSIGATWKPETWAPAKHGGLHRWLRADQFLDWLLERSRGRGGLSFAGKLDYVLRDLWLVGIDSTGDAALEDAAHRTIAAHVVDDGTTLAW
jgi:hypothetical protein